VGSTVKIISAFPYSEYGVGDSASGVLSIILPEGAKSGPHGIVVFDDYEKGLAYAKTVNKPIMLDFTGYACVNCRKMENNVWSDAMILPILNNEVVLISLYVDDKRDKSEQFISKTTGSEIETVGDKWTFYDIKI
jgi:thiol:disulfide interchange protein DsbD